MGDGFLQSRLGIQERPHRDTGKGGPSLSALTQADFILIFDCALQLAGTQFPKQGLIWAFDSESYKLTTGMPRELWF